MLRRPGPRLGRLPAELGVWLLEGTAVGLVGAALIGLIAAIILRSPKRSQGD